MIIYKSLIDYRVRYDFGTREDEALKILLFISIFRASMEFDSHHPLFLLESEKEQSRWRDSLTALFFYNFFILFSFLTFRFYVILVLVHLETEYHYGEKD